MDDNTVADVTGALRHRGPDGSATRRFDDAGLVHTRLRIIDLSHRGDEPMPNETDDVWVVFNGEIYNHHELRRDLERRGHRFRGASDTEVLPHLYEEHGVGLLELLRGMFAFAILDTRNRRMLLARDRFGIKPLFFAHGAAHVSFASEIAALRCFPQVDLTPNRQAIADYAALYCVPPPQTIFSGIEALEPGCAVEIRYGPNGVRLDRLRFHRWRQDIDHDLTLSSAADTADELVDRAVARQLESDVPLGVMLSGGIDSTLISAAAVRAGQEPLLTYNVRPSDDAVDETSFATAVAAHLGTRHTTVPIAEGAADWGSVTSFLRSLGQPLADPAIFGVAAVSKAMRNHVTVALSGDGGDELFGGYRLYWKIGALSRLRRLPGPLLSLAGVALRPLAAISLVGRAVPAQLTDLRGSDDTAIVESQYREVPETEHRSLLLDPDGVEPVRRHFERTWEFDGKGANRLERLCAHAVESGVRFLLGAKYLPKADLGSMRESLEVRVPLLDEDLADFGLRLPYRLRVERQAGKRVLREVARRHVPESIASRPKHGFANPIDTWLDGGFRSAAREALLDPSSPLADHFQPTTLESLVSAFALKSGGPGLSREELDDRVLMLTALDACLRR